MVMSIRVFGNNPFDIDFSGTFEAADLHGAAIPTKPPAITPARPLTPAAQPQAALPPGEAQADEAQITMRRLAGVLLGLTILGLAGYAYMKQRNVLLLAGLAGAGIGGTVCIATWGAMAPNTPGAQPKPRTPTEYIGKDHPNARSAAQLIATAGVAALLGAGAYYCCNWNPTVGAVVFGLPAGYLVGLHTPRILRLFADDALRDYQAAQAAAPAQVTAN
jgi:hypothetical protein